VAEGPFTADDRELNALDRIVANMLMLDAAERARVLRYLLHRWPLEEQEPHPHG
jgi:hypothetical protein